MLRWVWLTMCVFALKAWGQEPVWLFGAEGIRFPEEVAAYRQGGDDAVVGASALSGWDGLFRLRCLVG